MGLRRIISLINECLGAKLGVCKQRKKNVIFLNDDDFMLEQEKRDGGVWRQIRHCQLMSSRIGGSDNDWHISRRCSW